MTEATKGIDTDGILTKNPFRYRGYYYDVETGFYYLSSRYYDSEIRRFISLDTMDVLTATPMALIDKNLYASSKCLDNIVNNPQKIQGQSLAKIKYAELSPQWETGVLTKGNHAGMGWKATSHGDWLIQWHPGSQWHFNGSPHWKVSSGINGILRFPY